MNDDPQLLHRYVEEGSEEAFAELVRRHVDFVYAAALRQLQNAHRAEDVTQQVFTDLARKARDLRRRPDLLGWLYLSTRFAALQLRRGESRRDEREKEAHMIATTLNDAGEPPWERLAPVLDAALGDLGEEDRAAVLLRFFKDRSFADVGQALGVTEEAARKRVQRALEKLRPVLAGKGVTSTAAGLAFALTNQTVVAAPAGLAVSVTTSALQAAAAGTVGASLLAGWWQWIGTGKVAAVAVVLFTVGAVYVNRDKVTPGAPAAAPARAMAETGTTSRAGNPRATGGAAMAALTETPGPTLAEILAEPEELRSVSLYARYLLQLPVNEFPAVFHRILAVIKPEQKLTFLNLMLQRWGQVDPLTALAYLTSLETAGEEVGRRKSTIEEVLGAKNGVLNGWAGVQPEAALEWVLRNTGDFDSAAAFTARRASASLLNSTAPDRYIDWQRVVRLTGMIGALTANGQLREAADMLARAPLDPAVPRAGDAVQELMLQWVMRDAQAAANWLKTGIPQEGMRQAAYSGFVEAAAALAPDAATGFVRSLTVPAEVEAAGRGMMAGFRSRGAINDGYRWLTENMGDNGRGDYDQAVVALVGPETDTALGNEEYRLPLDGGKVRQLIGRVHDSVTRKRLAVNYAQKGATEPMEAIQTVLQFYSENERWSGVRMPGPTAGSVQQLDIVSGPSLSTLVSQWARKDRARTLAAIHGLTELSESERARMIAAMGTQ